MTVLIRTTLTALFLVFLAAAQPVTAAEQKPRPELLKLFADYRDWLSGSRGPAVDYSPDAVRARLGELQNLQRRLGRMNARGWSVSAQVDYLTVRAELDQQEFILRVTRPWARDPVFYVRPLLDIAFADLPAAGDELAELRRRLRAIPNLLDTARDNLTNVAADYADLAIRSLTLSDGVEDDYPYRETPPDGVIGWFEDMAERASAQPVLQPDIEKALDALRHFHGWLVANRDSMNAKNGVGREALDWFVMNGLLLPYTSAEMAVLSQRELDRLWAFYALERHRNRGLPELTLSESREEYRERVASTDRHIRAWLEDSDFISIPDIIPSDRDEMGYNVPWIVRKTPPNFWEQVQFRNPAPDHLHAVIPGHRFDAIVSEALPHPIRSSVNFGARWQGWAVYLEEAALQAGALEERPRTRELIYVFGIWRAARSLGDIRNQWNEYTAAETSDYWLDVTPLLDPNVARKYAYLRPAPGHGLEYTIGNIQMFALLADARRQLGEDFDLRAFHDEFISKGRIPISLIRYEMTGYEGDIRRFWDRPPLSTVLE